MFYASLENFRLQKHACKDEKKLLSLSRRHQYLIQNIRFFYLKVGSTFVLLYLLSMRHTKMLLNTLFSKGELKKLKLAILYTKKVFCIAEMSQAWTHAK